MTVETNTPDVSVASGSPVIETEPEDPVDDAVTAVGVSVSEPARAAPISRPATSAPATTGGLVPVPSAPPAVAGGTFFDPFYSYASSPEFQAQQAIPSAMLVDATSLSPERVSCTTSEPTVLIDLDPAEGDLFPIDPASASPALASRLALLRRAGVAVAWVSQNLIVRDNDIRVALFRSGLDPQGGDEVLLMRTTDERKQERVDNFAQDHCIIAIAGDDRSDFHELFAYLRNPADAAPLEPLVGEGWFLIPTPLIAERPAR